MSQKTSLSAASRGVSGVNRQERRAKAKELKKVMEESGNTWDELEGRYHDHKALAIPVAAVLDGLRNQKLMSYVSQDEKELLMNCVDSLAVMVTKYYADLDELYAIHRDRRGEIDVMEIPMAFDLSEKYYNLSLVFEEAIKHSMDHVADILQKAENRMLVAEHPDVVQAYREQKAQTEATQPGNMNQRYDQEGKA